MNINNAVLINGKDFALNSLASTNINLVKNNPTTIISLIACNNGATNAFLKLFDKRTVAITGTDTPIMTITIPALSQISISSQIIFNLGLNIAITNLIADLDNTAVAAGQVKLKLSYIQ